MTASDAIATSECVYPRRRLLALAEWLRVLATPSSRSGRTTMAATRTDI